MDGRSGARLQPLGGTGEGKWKEPMQTGVERLTTQETPVREGRSPTIHRSQWADAGVTEI